MTIFSGSSAFQHSDNNVCHFDTYIPSTYSSKPHNNDNYIRRKNLSMQSSHIHALVTPYHPKPRVPSVIPPCESSPKILLTGFTTHNELIPSDYKHFIAGGTPLSQRPSALNETCIPSPDYPSNSFSNRAAHHSILTAGTRCDRYIPTKSYSTVQHSSEQSLIPDTQIMPNPLLVDVVEEKSVKTHSPPKHKIKGPLEKSKHGTKKKLTKYGDTTHVRSKRMQFYKTKLCPWNDYGCTKGDDCRYAHSKEELRLLPNLSKTKLCGMYIQFGQCNKGPACQFAHSIEDLRSTWTHYKTRLCLFHLKGNCPSGPTCRHAHGEAELQIYTSYTNGDKRQSVYNDVTSINCLMSSETSGDSLRKNAAYSISDSQSSRSRLSSKVSNSYEVSKYSDDEPTPRLGKIDPPQLSTTTHSNDHLFCPDTMFKAMEVISTEELLSAQPPRYED